MEIKFNEEKIEVSFCTQLAFKGLDESIFVKLKENLNEQNVSFEVVEDKKEISVIVRELMEIDQVMGFVKKYKGLKVVGIFDQFNSEKQRNSYMLYSEINKSAFSSFTYLGWVDGQDDMPFSEQVDMLETKTQTFSGTHSMTGEKWKIVYSFPYKAAWNGSSDSPFIVEGNILTKYQGDADIVEIPADIAEIGKKAFEKCLSIEKLVLPKTIKVIHESAFSKCKNLKEISFSEGLQFIGNNAFSECECLIEIELPNSLSKIVNKIPQGSLIYNEHSRGVFSKCKSLERAKLGNKMKKIPDSWFKGCTNLRHVDIPASVTQIEDSAFENCKALEQIILPDGLKKVGGSFGKSFAGCSSLRNVKIPSTTIKIEKSSFMNCKKVVLAVQKDSEAENFAKKEGLEYQYVDI